MESGFSYQQLSRRSPEGSRLSVWQLLCCKLDFLFLIHTHTHTHTNLIEKGFKAVSAVLHHLMCRQDKMSKPQMRHRLQNPPWHVHVTCSRPDFHICRWRSWRLCLNIFKRDFGTTSSLVYVVKNLIILWEVRTSPVSFVANKTGIFKPEHDVFWTLTQQFLCTWKSPQKIEIWTWSR